MSVLSMLGVPSSAASYAAGQDQAPRALRDAGLVEALVAAGVQVDDAGDLTEQIWAPDPSNRRAQNLGLVVESVRELADRVPHLLREDRRLLVIGGNCTIALGATAGLDELFGSQCGLLYLDRHFDLNTPETTTDGALDWMGNGHALNLPGSADLLAGAFNRRPLLQPHQLVMVGVDPTHATNFEREQVDGLGIRVLTQAELIEDQAAVARRALDALPSGPFLLHLDVDVLDFVDTPVAEDTSGRNVGPTLDQLGRVLRIFVADPRWRALSIAEINPTRAAGEPNALPRLIAMLAEVLAHAMSSA